MHKLSLIVTILLIVACTESNEIEVCCPSEPITLSFSTNIISFPNVYTPNGNGINETYQPFLKIEDPDAIESFQFLVLRNEQVIYSEQAEMKDFNFQSKETERLELQYEVVTTKETFIGSIHFISLASACFDIKPHYFLLDQFDESILAYKEFTSEVGCP